MTRSEDRPRRERQPLPSNCFQSDWQLRHSCWHRLVILLKLSLHFTPGLWESMVLNTCLRLDLCSLALRCKPEMSAYEMVAFEFLLNNFWLSVATLPAFFFFFALHKGYPFTNSWVKTNLIWFFFKKKHMEVVDATHSSCFQFIVCHNLPLQLTH